MHVISLSPPAVPTAIASRIPHLPRVVEPDLQGPFDTSAVRSSTLAGVATSVGSSNVVLDIIGKIAVTLMDIRVPTTSRFLSDVQKNEIKSLIQPGDILLETNNAYPGWQIGCALVFKSQFSHSAIYAGNGIILESVSDGGVRERSLDDFLIAYHVSLLRPDYKSQQDIQTALTYARSCLGRPYDTSFDMTSDDKLYCSELVYNGLSRMSSPITSVPFGSAFGRQIVAPDGFLYSPDIHVVWDSGSSLGKNLLSHWPLAAGAAAGGVAGGLALGFGGAVLGTAAGLTLTWALARFWDPELPSGHVGGTGL